MLLTAGFVPEATEEGDAAVNTCGDSEEGDKKQIGEPAEGKRRLPGCVNAFRHRS
jgi:hypothetical protein